MLDVAGVGTTQCQRLTEAERQIRGLIEAVTDASVPEGTRIDIHLAGPSDAALAEARELAEQAQHFRDLAAARLRGVASDLTQNGGLSHAEVAIVLGVSKQRVTQLLAPPRPPAA